MTQALAILLHHASGQNKLDTTMQTYNFIWKANKWVIHGIR